MSKAAVQEPEQLESWHPAGDVLHSLLLEAILKNNPIPAAYRINYVANFYVGPLVKQMEKSFRMSRPEWIVLFCLMRQPRLNAIQISMVTGRPKTSVSLAVKQLRKKKFLTQKADPADGRRQVLQITAAGEETYKAIVGSFVAREAAMLRCLTQGERKALLRLIDKIIRNSSAWAKPY
jgi:DNA-binding MarR family transcriptional regulator